jgi:hypothetical protein
MLHGDGEEVQDGGPAAHSAAAKGNRAGIGKAYLGMVRSPRASS